MRPVNELFGLECSDFIVLLSECSDNLQVFLNTLNGSVDVCDAFCTLDV